VAAALTTAYRLFFVDRYNMVIHFLGLLWLSLVNRNMEVFRVTGKIAGVATSLALGYLAKIAVEVAMAYARLSPPLVTGRREVPLGPAMPPVPSFRFFNWARLWPVLAGALVVATASFAAHRAFRPPHDSGPPAALVPVPEARRAAIPLPKDP